MLQPRKSLGPKRTFFLVNLSASSQIFFSLLSLLTVLPLKVYAEYTDELFIVGPTPALRLNEEDLTTVLLVSNDNRRGDQVHGRFLNVRPEVGLLTSTARTFIQEGVTTEYATQVLGKTLQNGRSYAQLLKRSSRILYEPSVVTSWVGESAQTKSILQSHNDLQNDEQADWKDIDDRLLAKNDFVGNTDYVISHEINLQKPVINATEAITSSLSSSSPISLSVPLEATDRNVGHKPVDDDARTIIANKILPLEDLPTYTVKNYFSPSRFSWKNDSTDSTFDIDMQNVDVVLKSTDDKPRSPKVYYNKIMAIPVRIKNSNFNGKDRTTAKPLDTNRLLSTITYYGFANFTTMVGDSVIVFLPSTSNSNYGHVTSIKGEATLDGTNAYLSNVITMTEDLILPTYVKQSTLVTMTTTSDERIHDLDIGIGAMAEHPSSLIVHEQNTPKTATENVEKTTAKLTSSTDKLQTGPVSLILDDGARQRMTLMVDASSSSGEQLSTRSQTVLLSRPSNEDILRIYASLASEETAKRALPTLLTETELDTTAVESNITKEGTAIPTLESSHMKIDGGATTVFYADDPFANYIELATSAESTKLSIGQPGFSTKSSSISIETNKTVHESHTSDNSDFYTSTLATTVLTIVDEDRVATTVKEDFAKTMLVRENENEAKGPHSTTIAPQPDNSSTTPNPIGTTNVKEIEADEDINLLNCLRTSQVFLTQVPNLDTSSTSHLISEGQRSLETNALPAFSIEQATKYYCLPSTQVSEKMNEAISMQLERPSTEVTYDKSDYINIGSSVTKEPASMTAIHHNQRVTEAGNDSLDKPTIDYDKTEEVEDQEKAEEDTETYIENEGERETSSEEEIDLIYKTLYTTYTYLTTFFHDDTTSISSRKEVITNVITSTLGPETVTQTTKLDFLKEHKIAPTPKFVVPAELESILHSDDETNSNNNPSLIAESTGMQTSVYSDDSKFTKIYFTTYTYYTTIFVDGETEVMSRTGVHTNHVTDTGTNRDNSVSVAPNTLIGEHINASTTELNFYSTLTLNQENLQVSDMKEVRSISSNGDQQIINNSQINKAVSTFEDQISSESNNDEIIPAATLLLQTSFTTFTYYTTMYSGDDTNVLSRLETVTNAVTETLLPTTVEDVSLPVTFFTTFTYWTKLSKEGGITVLSREETVSSVIVPTSMHTEIDTVSVSLQDSDISRSDLSVSPTPSNMEVNTVSDQKSSVFKEPHESTTFYTTFTYYTTSYLDDQTITDSRFETITKVIAPEAMNEGTAILASKSTNTPALMPKYTETLATTRSDTDLSDITGNVITQESKKIIDAEGISTLYYTTQVIATLDEGGKPTQVTNKISSLYVDETKKAKLITSNALVDVADDISKRQYKTGLVRLIEGTRIANHTTTLYQSKVIGTVIDNRYAQIIESTSSFLIEKTSSPNVKTEDEILSSATIDKKPIQSTVKPSMESINVYATDISGSINDGMEYNTDESEEETPESRGKLDDENTNISDTNSTPPQSKKHIFTPVIRPFVSRNRPQFAPKKKNVSPSIATVITRSDFTPTITATPALKQSGRFSSSRRGGFYSAPISSTPSAGFSSRRFNRLHKGPNQYFGGSVFPSASGGSAFSSGRNYFSSVSHSANFKRSSSVDHAPSSGEFRGLSSTYVGNSRLRIKSTSSSSFGQRTTLFDGFSSNEGEDSTQEIGSMSGEEDSTTEKSRRSQNPLLRFRRPPFSRSSVSPPSIGNLQNSSGNSNSGFSARRQPISRRTKTSASTTITTTPRSPRKLQHPVNSSYQNRSRTQSNLFPPRGLFQTQQQQIIPDIHGIFDTKDKEDEESGDAEDNSDYDEDDEEGEYEADGDTNRRRRSNYSKIKLPVEASAHFVRSKREADTSQEIRSNFRRRYRRPKPAVVAEELSSVEGEVDIVPTTSATRARVGIKSRFISRYQSHDLHHTTTTTTTTNVPTSNHRLIRPTRPTTSRAQFTLRDKDTAASTQKNLSRSNLGAFRRPKTVASARRTSSTPSSGSRRSSSKSYATESIFRSSNARTRDSKGTTIRTRVTNMRGRNRNEFIAEPALPAFDGTITVTHVIPAEVTIPIINGKVTEYKNVVTAKTSTEILGPEQYTTFIGSNGQSSTALTREDTTVNFAGATELTQYVLHESSTTTITFTPTTIRGRKTSFSHIIPSSVYSVENVVSTVHPQISANEPLANILLSHLLLGNIGLPANPLLDAVTQPTQLGAQSPVTEYRTHTSTYVTTVFEGKSTVVPLTFQGKKIFTTIFDTSAQTITASEFITDTIVITPTNQQVQQVNSLLLQHLLLQQPKPEQKQALILQSKPPSSVLLSENLQDLDSNNIRVSNDANDIDDLTIERSTHKSTRKKNRKLGKSNNRHKQPATAESSVITLYVSGRRPGEFSTVLSTVPSGHVSGHHKRYAGVHRSANIDTLDDFYASDGSNIVNEYVLPEASMVYFLDYSEKENAQASLQLDRNMLDLSKSNEHTKPLESVVGDVSLWYTNSTAPFEQMLQVMTSTKAEPTKSGTGEEKSKHILV